MFILVDRGIYIKSVNSSGPAGLSGNVFVKDRIIMVNDHSLKSLSNMEAANHLRNSGKVVRLVLRRRKPTRTHRIPVDDSSDDSPIHHHTGPTSHNTGSTQPMNGPDEMDRNRIELNTNPSMNMPRSYDNEDDEVIKMRWKGKIPRYKTIKVALLLHVHAVLIYVHLRIGHPLYIGCSYQQISLQC